MRNWKAYRCYREKAVTFRRKTRYQQYVVFLDKVYGQASKRASYDLIAGIGVVHDQKHENRSKPYS